jgi:hypothetical protein
MKKNATTDPPALERSPLPSEYASAATPDVVMIT